MSALFAWAVDLGGLGTQGNSHDLSGTGLAVYIRSLTTTTTESHPVTPVPAPPSTTTVSSSTSNCAIYILNAANNAFSRAGFVDGCTPKGTPTVTSTVTSTATSSTTPAAKETKSNNKGFWFVFIHRMIR